MIAATILTIKNQQPYTIKHSKIRHCPTALQHSNKKHKNIAIASSTTKSDNGSTTSMEEIATNP